jgi:hypothetical protein
MNNLDHISESLETIYWAIILRFYSLMRIRDGKKFGSGINIPDPQHCETHTNKESEAAGSSISSPRTLADKIRSYTEPVLMYPFQSVDDAFREGSKPYNSN